MWLLPGDRYNPVTKKASPDSSRRRLTQESRAGALGRAAVAPPAITRTISPENAIWS